MQKNRYFAAYFSLIACQRSVQILYDMLEKLVALITFVRQSQLCIDRQTDKCKDQAPKQHHY